MFVHKMRLTFLCSKNIIILFLVIKSCVICEWIFSKQLQRSVHGIPFLKQLERPLQCDLQPQLVNSVTAWGAGRDTRHNENVCSLVLAPAIFVYERKIWAAGRIGFATHGYDVCTHDCSISPSEFLDRQSSHRSLVKVVGPAFQYT